MKEEFKTIDCTLNEGEYVANEIIELIYERYKNKIPQDAATKIKEAIEIMHKHLTKDYLPKGNDIIDIDLIERVTFKLNK